MKKEKKNPPVGKEGLIFNVKMDKDFEPKEFDNYLCTITELNLTFKERILILFCTHTTLIVRHGIKCNENPDSNIYQIVESTQSIYSLWDKIKDIFRKNKGLESNSSKE